jgi:hypothetical protein
VSNLKRVSLALVALLTLSGCATIGSLSDKAQIDLAMQRLTSELDELAGIHTEYTAELQGDYSYRVSVTATASELSTDQVVAATLIAFGVLGDGVFERTPTTFGLANANGVGVTGYGRFDLSEEELRGSIHRADAVSAAYGAPVSVSFGEQTSFVAEVPSPNPDWDALRALHIEDDSGAFPGLWWSGGFPPPEVTALLDSIGAVVPLGGDERWLFMDYSYEGLVTVSLVEADVDVTDPTASPGWADAVQIAQLI